MSTSTFRLRIRVPQLVRFESGELDRETFFSWIWDEFGESGLLGVHEGTLLSEQAVESGLETESWTIDAGEAPRERDWIASQEKAEADLYFSALPQAEAAAKKFARFPEVEVGKIEEQEPQDWDAEWKASFQGASVGPFWEILPPWVDVKERGISPTNRVLRVNPGAGFGTGTHETTQLCLSFLGEHFLKRGIRGKRVLDFGSGSGILSIGAAILGAQVEGVEIDPLAIENSLENASINQVGDRVRFSKSMAPAAAPYDIVIANILKPVLLEFAPALVERMAPASCLILSGLMQPDVEDVVAKYSALLGRKPLEVRALNEWRAIYWGPAPV